jgi:hypothetical protein
MKCSACVLAVLVIVLGVIVLLALVSWERLDLMSGWSGSFCWSFLIPLDVFFLWIIISHNSWQSWYTS